MTNETRGSDKVRGDARRAGQKHVFSSFKNNDEVGPSPRAPSRVMARRNFLSAHFDDQKPTPTFFYDARFLSRLLRRKPTSNGGGGVRGFALLSPSSSSHPWPTCRPSSSLPWHGRARRRRGRQPLWWETRRGERRRRTGQKLA